MEEAYALCDEIAIMDKGKILLEGPSTITQGTLQLHGHFSSRKGLPPGISRRKKHLIESPMGNMLEILTADPNETFSHLLKMGVNLQNVHLRQKNLEDLFLEITGSELRG